MWVLCKCGFCKFGSGVNVENVNLGQCPNFSLSLQHLHLSIIQNIQQAIGYKIKSSLSLSDHFCCQNQSCQKLFQTQILAELFQINLGCRSPSFLFSETVKTNIFLGSNTSNTVQCLNQLVD